MFPGRQIPTVPLMQRLALEQALRESSSVARTQAVQAELERQRRITEQRQREADQIKQEWTDYYRKQEEQRKKEEYAMFGAYTEALPKALEVAAEWLPKLFAL